MVLKYCPASPARVLPSMTMTLTEPLVAREKTVPDIVIAGPFGTRVCVPMIYDSAELGEGNGAVARGAVFALLIKVGSALLGLGFVDADMSGFDSPDGS